MTKTNAKPAAAVVPESTTDRIRRLLLAEEERMAGEKSATKRNTIARTVLMYCSELRKAEAEERKRTDALSKPLVVEWFRHLDSTEQSRFVRELQQLTAKRSSLA